MTQPITTALNRLIKLIALFLLFTTLSTTALAKTVTETKTFNKHLPNCKMAEIIAKNESKRSCDRVSGELNVKSIDCKCRKKTKCKTVLVASCTYDTRNRQPLYKNKPSETFGIKGEGAESDRQTSSTNKAKSTRSSTSKGLDKYVAVGPWDKSKKVSCRLATNQSRKDAKAECESVGGVYREQGSKCDCKQQGDQWQCKSIRKVKCL